MEPAPADVKLYVDDVARRLSISARHLRRHVVDRRWELVPEPTSDDHGRDVWWSAAAVDRWLRDHPRMLDVEDLAIRLDRNAAHIRVQLGRKRFDLVPEPDDWTDRDGPRWQLSTVDRWEVEHRSWLEVESVARRLNLTPDAVHARVAAARWDEVPPPDELVDRRYRWLPKTLQGWRR